ncbi:MAG TPA: ABC transporter permease, partial [Pyrinomonadaceae bacterium]|nr:ABC transporter permease [Pyrinomonadaceae bacterium]
MNPLKKFLFELQEISILSFGALMALFTKPRYIPETIKQMDLVGVGSLPIVILTGFFTGGVLVLQTFPTLSYYSAQGQ